MFQDYTSNYEYLLNRSNRPTMEIRRLRVLAMEIFKILNNLNSADTRDIFVLRSNSYQRKRNIEIPRVKGSTYWEKSLRILSPRVWNTLPEHIKSVTTLSQFQESTNCWFGFKCLCSLCKLRK